MSANDKTTVGSGRSNWRTPAWLVDKLHERYAFDYDAAASHGNAVTPARLYSTTDGTYNKGGADELRIRLAPGDGLAFPWIKRRVFINPPYSRGLIAPFVAKCASERNSAQIIVGVLPDARDTTWWQEHVAPYADDYPIGRVKFIDPDTGDEGGSPPGGTAIVVWRPDWLRPA